MYGWGGVCVCVLGCEVFVYGVRVWVGVEFVGVLGVVCMCGRCGEGVWFVGGVHV